jgi:hypothetical protein
MKKAIFALALSAASVAFGLTLAGAGSTPAAAQTNVGDVVGDATDAVDALTQVQDSSPEPEPNDSEEPEAEGDNTEGDRSNGDGSRDHNCPDRDGDGEPDAPQSGATSAEQA